jgi:hypoxanthine-guanine phosphoribosyltransferase
VQVHNLGYLLENLNYDNSVLIVDDVFDRGRSIEAIIAELKRLTRRNLPKDIRIATVWFKPERNVTDLTPDYFVQETNRWLVFPHELSGLTADEVAGRKPVVADLVLRAMQAKS